MTFGWANLSMVLLKSSRDKMQCFCSDVLEKLSNKTPTGNTLVMLEDPAFFLKGRWEHSFSCYIDRKQCSLSTVDSSCELCAAQPAWQSALSGLKPSASLDSGLLRVSLCGFSEGGGGSLIAVRSSALSEIWPLATGWISPSSALLPLSQSFLLVSHSQVPEFTARHTPLPLFCLLAEERAGVVGRVYQGFWGCQHICRLSLVC